MAARREEEFRNRRARENGIMRRGHVLGGEGYRFAGRCMLMRGIMGRGSWGDVPRVSSDDGHRRGEKKAMNPC